ncbi:MAG: hypothetical protein HeimC3_31910 [Candidatus Heimdallarchaeota archaeon LC_3]|nr:MAG: hypothetical protein HeimC3_31910 [Candidatus Heimdallarchaeota archaeon LC_3]
MDFESLKTRFPISGVIILIIGFLAGIITLYWNLADIIGKINVNYIVMFLFGIGFGELIHILRFTRNYPKIALLHSSFQDRIQIDPIKEQLNDQDVKLIELNFDSYNLWNREFADWDGAVNEQEVHFKNLIKTVKDSTELHYFSFATVPLAIHFGFLFSLRFQLQVYHYKRQKSDKPWDWSQKKRPKSWSLSVQESLDLQENVNEYAVVVEQSSFITDEHIAQTINQIPKIRISVPTPNYEDLRAEQQSIDIAREVRDVIDKFHKAKIIHLFCAVQSPTSFLIGQRIRRKMHPKIFLYDFDKTLDPPYAKVITLN